MKKHIINFSITAALFVVFAVFTIIAKFVDTSLVLTTNTKIGLSSINKPIFDSIKISDAWGTLSTVLFLVAALVALALIVIGVREFIKTKQLSKVNHKILFLIGLYMLTVFFFFLFEILIVNYRPLLDEGLAKASYPSSHTLLVCVVCLSACFIVPDYIKNKPLKITIISLLILISLLTPVTRMLAGMHWFSDIIGSLLLSAALVMCYYSTTCLVKKSNTEKTPN